MKSFTPVHGKPHTNHKLDRFSNFLFFKRPLSFLLLVASVFISGCIDDLIYPAQNSSLTFDNCQTDKFSEDVIVRQEVVDYLLDGEDGSDQSTTKRDQIRYFVVEPRGEITGDVVYLHGNGG